MSATATDKVGNNIEWKSTIQSNLKRKIMNHKQIARIADRSDIERMETKCTTIARRQIHYALLAINNCDNVK